MSCTSPEYLVMSTMIERMSCPEFHELLVSLGSADERHEVWHRAMFPNGCEKSKDQGCWPPQAPDVVRARFLALTYPEKVTPRPAGKLQEPAGARAAVVPRPPRLKRF